MTRLTTRVGLAIAFTGSMTLGLSTIGEATHDVDANPSCEALGYEQSFKMEDPTGTVTIDRDGLVMTISVGTYPDVAEPNPNNAVLGVSVDPSSEVTSGVVVVKGGHAATIYGFDAATPLHAPMLDNGKWPTISHVQVCWQTPEEPELGRVEVTKVVVGDEVPESEFGFCLVPVSGDPICGSVVGAGVVSFEDLVPGVYEVVESDPGVGFTVTYSSQEVTVVAGETATVTVTNTFVQSLPPTTPPTTAPPTTTPPPPTTTTPTTTTTPPTTAPPSTVASAGGTNDLPPTGANGQLALAGVVMVATGAVLVLLGRRPMADAG